MEEEKTPKTAKNKSGRNHVIAGCVAAVLAAGLGAGLALSHGAPAQEAPAAASTQAATTEAAPGALTASDVAAMLPSLSFDGQDVSISPDLVTVGVSDTGNVVVTNASTDDAATVVSSTAMRSAALAGELRDASVSGPSGDVAVSEVTWVTTDPDGSVTCGVSNDPSKAPASGDTSTVISGSKGWTMSDAAHDAAGLPAELPATGGEPVTDAGGNTVAPSRGVTDAAGAAGESGSQAGSATSSGQQHQAAASSGGQSSGSGSGGAQQAHQHTWVDVTREEPVYEDQPVYEQKWVSNVVYTDHERWQCSACGATFGSKGEMSSHIHSTYGDASHPNGASAINTSYSTSEDQGHYETVQTGTKRVQTGTKTVVTGQRCTGCGATR